MERAESAPERIGATSRTVIDEAPELYPATLLLDGSSCLVVGGGPLAFQKTLELLRCGARVRAVAASWTADFRLLDAHPRFERLVRPFEDTDLDRTTLVVAAT